ncbi:TIGR01777 family oxidoreductase [Neiella marina]|uniref:TIGR01777 family oxidoreductase n=1 Tax=Neiella holothuriorum TaxID=2870530 RepID=A0ABS7EFL2_9GAMM|nr:TIGR01777 family oxidoreductase [Neiella holothuriorum]MBW8191009.1 TIGR01777 family oxidoreductase [Neiella holothuriorum]
MRVLITGGTGFIGRHLIRALHQRGAEITVLSRNTKAASVLLGPKVNVIDHLPSASELNNIDAVFNLAGEPIAEKRWSQSQKRKICDSRWQLTEQLANTLENCANPPVFISGSAIGFYGNQGNNWVDEHTPIDEKTLQQDFAHQVCFQWEQNALRVAQLTRVCIVRTGLVLAPQFGALKKMLPPYRLGLGGPIGSGQQYMSWIHIDDMVQLLLFLLDSADAHGIYNATAPQPATNAEFSRQLAATLNRPHFLFTPALLLKLALGEMAQLLIEGQRVKPTRLLDAGFNFQYPDLSSALHQLLDEPKV